MASDMVPADYEGLLAGLNCEVVIVQQPVGLLSLWDNVTLVPKIKVISLRDVHKPLGVAEYKLAQSLPDDLKGKLPTIEELEEELGELEEKL